MWDFLDERESFLCTFIVDCCDYIQFLKRPVRRKYSKDMFIKFRNTGWKRRLEPWNFDDDYVDNDHKEQCDHDKKWGSKKMSRFTSFKFCYSPNSTKWTFQWRQLLALTGALVFAPLLLFHITSSRSSKSLYNLLTLLKNLEHLCLYIKLTSQLQISYWLICWLILTGSD